MTHHDDTFIAAPAHLLLVPDANSVDGLDEIALVAKGQGTIGFALSKLEPFTVTIGAPQLWATPAFRWDVGYDGVALLERTRGAWREVAAVAGSNVGLDPEPACQYWFSVDAHNRRLSYGKGEMRLKTRLASFDVAPAPHDGLDPYAWLLHVSAVQVTPQIVGATDIWRDPVTVEPPLRIVPRDTITMATMAAGTETVVENLTAVCQVLYANVAGESFVLDGEDFPEFSAAIQESIDSDDGWCHQKLIDKASEFGKPNLKATYLRITMGVNQGESPGIPFVMEIWPHEHYSPIHNHAGADAVIRVLHGEIHVSMFRMLSPYHQEPFSTASFQTGDVTWISARLNQVHRLLNDKPDACITIQCYGYAETDQTHYPYFDYLQPPGVGHFAPNSDMDFLAFKAQMKTEWEKRHPGS